MAAEMVRLVQPGFTKRPNRKSFENFVSGYLKLVSSGARLREERKFIEKAIVLLNLELGIPCCENPTAIVSLITPHENELTRVIREAIRNAAIDRRSFLHAINRVLVQLQDYLNGCCITTP